MVAFQSKKSKAKLLAGGVIKPEQVTTGVIEVETVASGAMLPTSTGGGVISGGDTPPTPVVMYTFTINPTPTDAVVKINGSIRNSITSRENTTITWEVSRSGYITQSGSETLTANVTKEISLVAIPTYTFAISPVPADAEVIINGEAVNSVTVETGTTVDWSVSKTGYISQSGSEIVTADVTKEIELEKVKVQFTVNATPDNAVIKIDGIVQSSVEVDYGSTVTWEVSADGYVTQSGTTEALTENTSLDIALEVVKYTFTINPTPTDAVVTINGTITNSVTVNVGSVIDWSVEADGYTPQSGKLTLMEDKTLDIALAEILPEYTFTINPTPADAVVTINDVQQSSITADAGTVITWSVSAEGYTSQSGSLTLSADKTIDVVLEIIVTSEIKAFSADAIATWFVDENGDLYGCGRNNYGQQGDGTTNNVLTFTKRANGVKDVSSSGFSTWYITDNGDLYGIGYNYSGQQGSGTTTKVTKFTKRASGVKKVVSSIEVTWYLTNTGDLYGCGIGDFGNQGNGSITRVTTFTKRASNVKDICADSNVTWYLTESGDLYGCGRGVKGAMGNESTTDVKWFTKRASGVKAFYGDADVTWYLTNAGDLYGCGLNNYGQQGDGTTNNVLTFTKRANGVKSFGASSNLTWYLTEDGDIYGCGRNNQGQQGDGTTDNVATFTKRASGVKAVYATSIGSWYVDENNELYGCGTNNFGQQSNGTLDDVLIFTKRASDVKNVYLSHYTTWYEDKNGYLYGCGSNSYGQQGNGTTDNVLTLTKVSI